MVEAEHPPGQPTKSRSLEASFATRLAIAVIAVGSAGTCLWGKYAPSTAGQYQYTDPLTKVEVVLPNHPQVQELSGTRLASTSLNAIGYSLAIAPVNQDHDLAAMTPATQERVARAAAPRGTPSSWAMEDLPGGRALRVEGTMATGMPHISYVFFLGDHLVQLLCAKLTDKELGTWSGYRARFEDQKDVCARTAASVRRRK